MDTEPIKRCLKDEEHVFLGYLFGSYAQGSVGSLSDVDIAVYLDDATSRAERFDIRLNLIKKLTSALKMSNVDVVVMNDASIILNYEVIKPGRALVIKDPELKLEVESRILSKYLDWMYYERRSLDDFLEGMLKREAL